MFGKALKDITYQDIDDLINVYKQDEGYHLDFKSEPQNEKIDEFSNKMLKIFSSFANTHGGYVIIGVEEVKENGKKEFKIKGTNLFLGKKNLVEWLNQNISGKIEPKLYYPDAKQIPIPDSEKVILVYYIPESTQKPYFNNHEKKYFVRINDSSEPANHYTIRDMFDSTRRRYDELNDFLAKRNILDENDPNFGFNKSSRLINSRNPRGFLPEKKSERPLFLLSFIPKFPNNEIIKSQDNTFDCWIKNNSSGYIPNSDLPLFSTNKKILNINGTIYKSHENLSYIEFQNNGYIEAGLCDTLYLRQEENRINDLYFGVFCVFHITNCIGYIMSQLKFSKKYYDYINYDDEIILQISFRNVLNIILEGRNKGRKWRTYNAAPKNETDNCFKVLEKFIPSSLDETKITEMGMRMAEKILFAFNINDNTACFIDGKIDENLYKEIDSI